jgi:hypothetical protein
MSSIYLIRLVNGENFFGVIEKHRGYTLVIREFLNIKDHFYKGDLRIIPILSIFSMNR